MLYFTSLIIVIVTRLQSTFIQHLLRLSVNITHTKPFSCLKTGLVEQVFPKTNLNTIQIHGIVWYYKPV